MGEVTPAPLFRAARLLILLTLTLSACIPGNKTEIAPLAVDQLEAAWQQTSAAALSRPPQFLKNIVIVLPQSGALQALELKNGEERWRLETPAQLWRDSLTTTLDSVLLAGEQGRLLALGTRRGVPEWEITLQGEAYSAPLVDRYVIFTAANTTPPNTGSTLYALNAANGETLWRFDLPGATMDSPTRAADVVLFKATQDNANWLYALGAADGVLRWRVALEQPTTALTATRAAVLTSSKESLSAFDLAAGKPLWEITLPAEARGIIGSAEEVITWSATEINTWSADDGQLRWQFPISDLNVPPILRQGQLLVVTPGGELIAIDVQTGQAMGRFTTGITTPDTLNAQGTWVILSDKEGDIYAFQAKEP